MSIRADQLKALVALDMDPQMLRAVVEIMDRPCLKTLRNQRYEAKKASLKRPDTVPKSVPPNVPEASRDRPEERPNGTISTVYKNLSSLSSSKPLKKSKKVVVAREGDAQIDEWFEDLWPEYPKRQGSNPKKPAKIKFRILVRKGGKELALAIAEGVGRLAASLERDGVEPRYYPQMITWLNQERWNDGSDEGSEPEEQNRPHVNGTGRAHA